MDQYIFTHTHAVVKREKPIRMETGVIAYILSQHVSCEIKTGFI